MTPTPNPATVTGPGHDYGMRVERLIEAMQDRAVDALIITPSADLIYLTGYGPPPLERLTALIVRPGTDPVLLVPALEQPRAQASPAGGLMAIEPWRDGQDMHEAAARLLPTRGRLGATDQMWAAHLMALQRTLPDASFVSATAVVATLRIRKDRGEVELLRAAGASADETFARVSGQGLGGRREQDVARALVDSLVATGHDQASFWIVGSGPNGASPHHDSGARTVAPGDAVVLDFGGRLQGYCSDITRTVSVGEPSSEVAEIHAIVREAQEAAFRAVEPGVPAQEIDRVARRIISDAGHGEAFIHRTGHGIGLDEHEDPYLVEGNEAPLEPGMAFSIEPGIYLDQRFGVRIEDIVVVNEDGAERLNHAPRELTVVR